jgi:hypothetical protein
MAQGMMDNPEGLEEMMRDFSLGAPPHMVHTVVNTLVHTVVNTVVDTLVHKVGSTVVSSKHSTLVNT